MDILRVAGQDICGDVVEKNGGYRLRIQSPESEGALVLPGHTVEVGLPGRLPKQMLVAEVVTIPDTIFTWIVFVPPIRPSLN